jgi:hypothetical protein
LFPFAVEFKADSRLLFRVMRIEAFSDRLKDAAIRAGFGISYYGQVGKYGLPVLERHAAGSAPSIYIAAGVHGNEPAPPLAVLDLLRRDTLPHGANYTIFPLVNPAGLAAGTRENADGIDLNRDYGLAPRAYETKAQLDWIGQRQFDLTLCLHEDDEGQGFYVYSHDRDGKAADYSTIATEAAAPITGIDSRREIDGMPARNGRMFPPEDVMDQGRSDQPEALRLFFHHGARLTMTTETPSTQPVTKRIAAQCAVVEAVVKAYLD